MMLVAVFLGLGLIAIAQAQDECAAVAASIPLCAASHADPAVPCCRIADDDNRFPH